jgi:hypothetical protein
MIPTCLVRCAFLASLCGLAAACASPDRFAGLGAERGVFASPYVAPEISRQGIGPEPEGVLPGRRPYLDLLYFPGRGPRALDRNGNVVRLSRNERRQLQERFDRLRERAEQIERERREQHTPPASAIPRAPSHGGGSLPR